MFKLTDKRFSNKPIFLYKIGHNHMIDLTSLIQNKK